MLVVENCCVEVEKIGQVVGGNRFLDKEQKSSPVGMNVRCRVRVEDGIDDWGAGHRFRMAYRNGEDEEYYFQWFCGDSCG